MKDTVRRRGENKIELYGLLGSVVLHAVFLTLLIKNKPSLPEAPETIEVTIEPPQVAKAKSSEQPRQIVSPSEAPNISPPIETNRESEVDAFAPEEKIHRGDGGGMPSQKPSASQQPSQPAQPKNEEAKKSAPSKTSEKSATKSQNTSKEKSAETKNQSQEKSSPEPKEGLQRTPPHLTNLRLDSSTLEEKFGAEAEAKKAAAEESSKTSENGSRSKVTSLSQYKAFSRPPGTGAAFLGSGGLSDYLPNLPDGDITLLNAKASQYAGFVRRVAVQVFAQLRTRGWEDLTASEVRRIGDFTTVEAVLSQEGKLLEVRLIGTSGSQPFDSVLGDATKAGARDPNPPPGAAASDGKIHFIFKARSWSAVSTNPRNGAMRESRWLLLATGLE